MTESQYSSIPITISSPATLQIFQRRQDNNATITIEGRYTAPATSVEARTVFMHRATGEAVDWTPIFSAPANGVYCGKLTLPAGGWYELQVRIINGQSVVAKASVQKIGVGEIFITAGQSNSANHGSVKQYPEDDKVVAFTGSAWQVANDPQPIATGEGGAPWPVLGTLLAQSLQMPIGFVSVGVGGTSVEQWLPGSDFYNHLKSKTQSLGLNGAKAVLWHQGESDSIAGTDAETYKARLAKIISNLNEDIGYKLPWAVAAASFHPDASEEKQSAVREGQRRLWIDGLALEGPDTDDLRGSVFRYDTVHFNGMGLKVHAQRWFALLWAQLYAAETLGP